MANNKYTAIAVQDSKGRYTAFVYGLPGLIVQGDSMDDVDLKMKKLINTFQQRLENMKNNLVLQPIKM